MQGFKLYDSETDGNLLQTMVGAATTATETGLAPNTQYSRWVTAYNGGYETSHAALPPTYTLADPPILSVNVYTWANNYDNCYSGNPWPGFTNPQGFGTSGLVSKFKYKWSMNPSDAIADGEGTDWTSDPMMATPPTYGVYYLYLRSYNADGVSNPNWLMVGPFCFADPFTHFHIYLQSCNTDAGIPGPPGVAQYMDPVTVHANTNVGYRFVNWTTDGCGGYNVASHDPDYRFSMPSGDMMLYANYEVTSQTLIVTACSGGTAGITDPAPGGSTGSYPTATSVTIAATPDSSHTFKNWTTDSCGGTAEASTANPYTFPMTGTDLTLYANFNTLPHLTLASVPAAGGTLTGDGYYAGGTAVPIDATANPGFYFVGWATTPSGVTLVGGNVTNTIITRKHSYTYTTSASGDSTLYAVFAVGKFFEGYEGLTVGKICMNDSRLESQQQL